MALISSLCWPPAAYFVGCAGVSNTDYRRRIGLAAGKVTWASIEVLASECAHSYHS